MQRCAFYVFVIATQEIIAQTETKPMYQVQEFATGKWWPVKSFDTEQEAIDYAKTIPKSRVKKVR